MPLTGALSNHVDKLSRLGELKQRLLKQAKEDPRSALKPKPKAGEIRDCIVNALTESSPEPMTTKAIIAYAERLLGKPVSRDTVDSFLSVSSRKSRPLFVRVEPGRYRLARYSSPK